MGDPARLLPFPSFPPEVTVTDKEPSTAALRSQVRPRA